MKGVTFGEYHSFDDLHLVLSKKTIGTPTPKIETIDIPGADGVLDLTEFFGDVKYNNRTLSFDFSTLVPQKQFMDLFSIVQNAIHGKKVNIILDDDHGFFYIGRPNVSAFTNEKNIGLITVEAECEPFKYKVEKTVVKVDVSGTKTISLTNSRKRAVPEVVITTDSSIRIEYKGSIWDLGSGSFTLPELELVEGENPVTLTGAGTITFTYQEGSL